jgi:hypothetical protein
MKNLTNNNIICSSTYYDIKNDLFNNFLVTWYFNTKIKKNDFTFDLSEINKNISKNYGKYGYFKLIYMAYFLILKKSFFKIKKFITMINK